MCVKKNKPKNTPKTLQAVFQFSASVRTRADPAASLLKLACLASSQSVENLSTPPSIHANATH